jgi:hypothetical protein
MVTYDRRALHKGGNVADDDVEFLKPSSTNPFEAKSSGQDSRWSDNDGFERGLQDRAGPQAWQARGGDNDEFLRPSQSETDYAVVHQRLTGLIDNQADQPAGKMLGGGAVNRNPSGIGEGKARFKPKTGPQNNGGL